MSTEDTTVQEQVRAFRFPFGALESLEWEGPLGPSLPRTVPGSIEEAKRQARELSSLIRKAQALQMSDQEIDKLEAYKHHLAYSICSHQSIGKAIRGGKLTLGTGLRMDQIMSRLDRIQETLEIIQREQHQINATLATIQHEYQRTNVTLNTLAGYLLGQTRPPT